MTRQSRSEAERSIQVQCLNKIKTDYSRKLRKFKMKFNVNEQPNMNGTDEQSSPAVGS